MPEEYDIPKEQFEAFFCRLFNQSPSWKNISYFNRFVDTIIPQLFGKYGTLQRKFYPSSNNNNKPFVDGEERPKYLLCVNFTMCPLESPDEGITPTEARLSDLDYCSTLYANAEVFIYDHNLVGEGVPQSRIDAEPLFHTHVLRIPVIRIPVMVGSDLCVASRPDSLEDSLDKGGYFVINGHEKVFITRERKPLNRLAIKKNDESEYVGKIKSRLYQTSPGSNAQLRLKKYARETHLTIDVSKLAESKAIDVPLVFAILGYPHFEQVLSMIMFFGGSESIARDLLSSIWQRFNESLGEISAHHILDNIKLAYYGQMAGKRHPFSISESNAGEGETVMSEAERVDYLFQRLLKDMFPHCGERVADASMGHELREKTEQEMAFDRAMFLAYCCSEMFKFSRDENDAVKRHDPDHMANKRFDTADSLLTEIMDPAFREILHEYVRTIAGRLAFCEQEPREVAEALVQDLVRNSVKSRFPNVRDRLSVCISTGDWTRHISGVSTTYVKNGITQTCEHMNHYQYNSAQNRVTKNLNPDKGKHVRPRMPHATHNRRIDPTETPEGKSCGIVCNFALMCIMSRYQDPRQMLRVLATHESLRGLFESIVPEHVHSRRFADKVFLDGALVGTTPAPEAFVRAMIALRRECGVHFNEHVSFYYNFVDRWVLISTEEGRALSPLEVLPSRLTPEHVEAVIRARSPLEALRYALDHALIEYLDFEEEENYAVQPPRFSAPEALHYDDAQSGELARQLVAARPEIPSWVFRQHPTHRELHDAMILGVCSSSNPFAEFNQSPRNIYYAAMCKQALSIPFIGSRWRVDTMTRELFYCSRPLVENFISGCERTPTGIMEMVAVALYTGQNTEDSIVANDTHCGMGGGMSTDTKTYRHIIDPEKSQIFCSPAHMVAHQDTMRIEVASWKNYSKIDSIDGLPRRGEWIERGDVVIGIAQLVDDKGKVKLFKCFSVVYDEKFPSRVIDVLVTSDARGNRIVKVKLQKLRVPQDGDKFASRHGQKGTYGTNPYLENDMLFCTRDGIVPSKIINPHCFPSRMTGGQLQEGIYSQHAAVYGKSVIDYVGVERTGAPAYVTHIDSSKNARLPFGSKESERIERELVDAGWNPLGEVTMKNGRNGRTLQAKIFLTPMYYQRLRHMSGDKERSRSDGHRNRITRQPPAGQKNRGSTRFGQMEVDCLKAHGTASMLHDRLYINSDRYVLPVCERCGTCAEMPALDSEGRIEKEKGLWCRVCHHSGKKQLVCNVEIPYASFLAIKEEMCMGILPKIITTK